MASPIDVTGRNEAATAPMTGETNKYSSTVVFDEITYSKPGTYVYTITEDETSMPADAEPKETKTYTATVVVTKVGDELTALEPTYSPSPVEFTNKTKTTEFDVTKQWLNQSDEALTGVHDVTLTVRYSGEEIAFTDVNPITVAGGGMVTNTSGNGSISVADGKLVLTSDESGNWPTAHFEGVRAGRYTVFEKAHSEVEGEVETTYTVTERTKESGSYNNGDVRVGNIVRDPYDLVTITNKQSKDTYTNIQVKKVWKAGDTEYTTDIGKVNFELWEAKTSSDSGSVSSTEEQKIGVIVKNSGTELLKTSDAKVGNFVYVKFTAKVGDVNGAFDNLKTEGGNRADYRFFSNFDGNNMSGTDSEVKKIVPISPLMSDKDKYTQGQAVTIEYKIPITDAKDRNGNDAKGMLVEFQWQGWNDLQFVEAEIQSGKKTVENCVSTFTLSAANNWTWNSGKLPLSKDDGASTWQYYIVEKNVPTGFTVSYEPSGTSVKNGTVGGLSTGGTIKAINTQTTVVSRKVKKAWEPAPASGTKIKLGLYSGKTPETATHLVREIELDGVIDGNVVNGNKESAAWIAEFTNLPKYDADGSELVYIVKETKDAEGYTVKYGDEDTAEYVLASDSTVVNESEDLATVTNLIPADVDIKIIKIDETTREDTSPKKLEDAHFKVLKYVEGSGYIVDTSYTDPERTTNDDGEITFNKLGNGQYKIEETLAPDGYVRLNSEDGAIYFTIQNGTVTWTDKDGNAYTGEQLNEEHNLITYQSDVPTFTIGNEPGAKLPATGGPGTAAIYTAGVALMMLAVLGFVFNARKRSRGEGID